MTTEVNYENALEQLETNREDAVKEVEKRFDQQIADSAVEYGNMKQSAQDYANTQSKLQQEQTEFAIQQVEQQKDQAQKDYTREQSAAYTDWQKQSDPYGANAEQMAASGMQDTGYSESSQVSMYNAYQNRVATARESYNQAVTSYNNAITEARLQNNAILAEIAAQALEQQLALALEGFQYKNTLLNNKASAVAGVNSNYYDQYLKVLDMMEDDGGIFLRKPEPDTESTEDDTRSNAEKIAAKLFGLLPEEWLKGFEEQNASRAKKEKEELEAKVAIAKKYLP